MSEIAVFAASREYKFRRCVMDVITLNGGLQSVPELSVPQVIYLDFDGETTSYDGEILAIDSVTVQDSQISAERAELIAASLNERYAAENVVFVTTPPADGEYSTIFVGKSDEISALGSYGGLAETVDKGNLNRSDNAFVLLDASDSNSNIIEIISHEADHLLGTLDHGGEGLDSYAWPWDVQNVYAGDVVDNIELNYGARMVVHSGGYAYYIDIAEGSMLTVNSGGYAGGVVVSSGAALTVSSGGIAEGVLWTPFEGTLIISDGATVSFATDITGVHYGSNNKLISRGAAINGKTVKGLMYVGVGGTAAGNVVDGGSMSVIGGTAMETLVSGGRMSIESGTATGTLNSKGIVTLNGGSINGFLNNSELNIYGGTADAVVNEEGRTRVYGGNVTNMEVTSYGELTVYSGGNVSGVIAEKGRINISSGGMVTDTTLNEWGVMNLASGASASTVEVAAGGSVTLSSGAETMGLNITSFGAANVGVGAYANNNRVESMGTLNVSGSAAGNRISGGTMNVAKGAEAVHNYISSGGKVSVNGGSALDTTISRGGTMSAVNAYISAVEVYSSGAKLTVSGGSALNVEVYSSGASMQVNGNAYLSGGAVYSSASVNINGSAKVSNWQIGSKGSMTVAGGALVKDLEVYAQGKLTASKGVTVDKLAVKSAGTVVIESGAVVTNAAVSSGGSMVINGTNRNGLVIHSGAVVSAGKGAIFNFDIRNIAPDQFMIVGLDRLKGAPTYTITVAQEQTAGEYYLAVSSDLSDMSISMTIGDGSVNYGKLVMDGDELYYRDKIYSLAFEFGSTLTLSVKDYISTADLGNNDIDGNGLGDIILVHDAGFAGAWTSTGDENAVKKWMDLSTVGKGFSMLGTGNVYASCDEGNDVFLTNGSTVGAWIVEDGKVTGYETVATFGKTTEILGLGDFDGDNITDILLRSTAGDVGCYFADGNGWNYFQSLGDEWDIAAVGDFNGDGRDDIVLRHEAGFAGTWLTQENGKVKWADLDTLKSDTEIIGAGDFNGDGVDDVLLKKGDWVGAWIVEDGSVTDVMGIGNVKHDIEQIADFDGDGIDDLRIRSEYGDLGVIYVKGADTTEWKYFGSVGDEWKTGFSALA